MGGDPAPFDFPGDHRGVLCVHGFTGTPFELRYLGKRLNERGFTVMGPALPGHCTTPEQLDGTSWTDWYGAAERALDDLSARCDQVAVVGLSMGGALTLHLARHRGAELTAIAALATPLWLPPIGRALVGLYRHTPLRHAVPILPKKASDVRDPVMQRDNPAYTGLPARALLQLDDLLRIVRDEVGAVHTPAMVMHARQDHSVPFACSEELALRLGSGTIEHRTLYASYHVIGIDVERDLVAREVGIFFEEQFEGSPREAH